MMVPFLDELILDVGCGDGVISSILKNNGIVVGLDPSVQLLKKANLSIEHTVLGCAEFLPFRDSVFTLCTSLDSIEHIPDVDRFIEEVKYVMRPNSSLLVVTPNLASLVERFLLLLGFQPSNIEVSSRAKFGSYRNTPPVGHVRAFTLRALIEMFRFYGFTDTSIRVTTYYTGILKYLDLLAGKIRKTTGSLLIVLFRYTKLKQRTIT